MARIDLGGAYYRGSHLVGHGTREPHHGVLGALRLDVVRFPVSYFGFEFDVLLGATPSYENEILAGIEGAALVAPVTWSGASRGSFIVGAGGGLEGAERPSLDEELRLYPLILARARLFPSDTVSLHVSLRVAPITTNTLTTRLYKTEIAMGVEWANFGFRLDIEETRGGDPERTYREFRFGPFFGAAFY
jgi:hypothetical protein